MDSIVNKLTEIEESAAAIVQHAEDQKTVLDREYEEKRRAFDDDLERTTQAKLDEIRSRLKKNTAGILDSQSSASEDFIRILQKEYQEKHTEYAHEILNRITEV